MNQEEILHYIKVNRTSMEFIWNKVKKTVKNNIPYIKYIQDDIPALYYSGMIDIDQVVYQDFRAFFDICHSKEDGCFYLDHDTFIKMGQFRYYKIVGKPFDPDKIRLGKYNSDRLWKLFENSIFPSTCLPRDFIEVQFSNLKKHIDENGMIEVTPNIIDHIKYAVNNYPSPRRKLELDVAKLNDENIDEMIQAGESKEISSFTDKTDIKKQSVNNLNQILVKTSSPVEDVNRKPTEPEFNLKSFSPPKINKV